VGAEFALSIDLRLLPLDTGRSVSGGGVGGNMDLLVGGSDCCRDRLARPGLTRLSAAYDPVLPSRERFDARSCCRGFVAWLM